MTSNHNTVWLLDQNGFVKRFDTKNKKLQLLTKTNDDNQPRFVKLTSSATCLWAITCEGNVKVYVFSTDIPIREHVITYENQRWNPLQGFCDKLLPSDRPSWSNASGTKYTPKHYFELPSDAWAWEQDWNIQEKLPSGESLGPDGWSYAIDFSLDQFFVPKRNMLMMVRKREWVRTQRFIGYEKWLNIDPLPDNQGFDRVIDIAIGAENIQVWTNENNDLTHNQYEMFDENESNLESIAVWILTSGGNLYFRKHVCRLRPQGNEWIKINVDLLDHNSEQLQKISIGPNGNLWALSSSGKFFVRIGINKSNLSGNFWQIVELPKDIHVLDFCISSEHVWVLIDRPERKIMYRIGIRNQGLEKDQDMIGYSWSEMEGKMGAMSMSACDQLWTLESDHTSIWIRHGISKCEPMGKSWYKLSNKYINPVNTLAQLTDQETCADTNQTTADNITWLDICARSCQKMFEMKKIVKKKISNPPWRKNIVEQLKLRYRTQIIPFVNESWNLPSVESLMIKSNDVKLIKNVHVSYGLKPIPLLMYAIDNTFSKTPLAKLFEQKHQPNDENYSNCTVQVLKLKMGHFKKWILKMIYSNQKGHYQDEIDFGDILYIACATKCIANKWAKSKLQIHVKQMDPFELEFASDAEMEEWQNILISVTNKAHQTKHKVLTIQDPICLLALNYDGAVYAGLVPDKEHHGNVDRLINRMFELNIKEKNICASPINMYLKPVGETMFSDIVCCDKYICWASDRNGNIYRYVFDDNEVTYDQESDEFDAKFNNEINEVVKVEVCENQRWFPIQGFSNNLLPTDRPKWSDPSGTQERDMSSLRLSNKHWQWLGDWQLDNNSLESDADGWSYAMDFTTEFHKGKRITDCVRRKVYCRKIRISTRGPWIPINDSKLAVRSMSMCKYLSDSNQSPTNNEIKYGDSHSNHVSLSNCSSINSQSSVQSAIIVWVVSVSGNALCRIGVNLSNPAGDHWLHVSCSKPLTWISVSSRPEVSDVSSAGTDFALKSTSFVQVWALAKDGSIFIRHGISLSEPAGTLWLNVISNEPNLRIIKLFAIPTGCFAISDQLQLWYREGIQRTRPDGTKWCLVPQNPLISVFNISCSPDCRRIFASGSLADGRLVFCENQNPTVDLQRNFHMQWKILLYNAFVSMQVL